MTASLESLFKQLIVDGEIRWHVWNFTHKAARGN
jgi:hypothetical protein